MFDSLGRRLLDPAGSRLVVGLLLAIQAGLLGDSATRHSPTQLEPAFLASGISHWHYGRFELYRVNPPLARMVAALPVLAVGCETDWSRFYDGPGSRAEFPVGEDFVKANGPRSMPLFVYARWGCIPFSLIGAYFAYRWAKELYGPAAGLLTLTLFVFEPNLLAHGELVTPDGACTAFGILAGYTYWRWLRSPTWTRAILAGGALGLAELAKMSWVILFGLWPLLWMIWRLMEPRRALTVTLEQTGDSEARPTRPLPSWLQLSSILLLAIYVINLGYAFDGTFTPLKDYQFVSTVLSGRPKAGTPGNRWSASPLATVPVPLPKQYLLGFDSQKKDFEDFGQKSYLRGVWKDGGWWYYYLYGLWVKVPIGTWALFGWVLVWRLRGRLRPHAAVSRPMTMSGAPAQGSPSDSPPGATFRDECVLLLPAVTLFVLVSSQTEFNLHLRYVFPCLGLWLIFLGSATRYDLRPRELAA
jgi:hypothetical protein